MRKEARSSTEVRHCRHSRPDRNFHLVCLRRHHHRRFCVRFRNYDCLCHRHTQMCTPTDIHEQHAAGEFQITALVCWQWHLRLQHKLSFVSAHVSIAAHMCCVSALVTTALMCCTGCMHQHRSSQFTIASATAAGRMLTCMMSLPHSNLLWRGWSCLLQLFGQVMGARQRMFGIAGMQHPLQIQASNATGLQQNRRCPSSVCLGLDGRLWDISRRPASWLFLCINSFQIFVPGMFCA